MKFAKKFTAITIVLAMVLSLMSFSAFAAADVTVTSDLENATVTAEGIEVNFYLTPGSYGMGSGFAVNFDNEAFTISDVSAAGSVLKPNPATVNASNTSGKLNLFSMGTIAPTEGVAVATVKFIPKEDAAPGGYNVEVSDEYFVTDMFADLTAEANISATLTIPELINVTENYVEAAKTVEYGAEAELPTNVTLNGKNAGGEDRTATATVAWDTVDTSVIGTVTVNGVITPDSDLTVLADGVKATCEVTVTKAASTGVVVSPATIEVGMDEAATAGSDAAIAAINDALAEVTAKFTYANGEEAIPSIAWDAEDIAAVALTTVGEGVATIDGVVADTDHVLAGLNTAVSVSVNVVDISETVEFEVKDLKVGKKYQVVVTRALNEDAAEDAVMAAKDVEVKVMNGETEVATLTGSFEEGQSKLTIKTENYIAASEEGKTYTVTVKYGSRTLDSADYVVGKKATTSGTNISVPGSSKPTATATPAPTDEPTDPTDPTTPVDPTPAPIGGFTDIADVEWAQEAIVALAEAGIISGDGNGNFNPSANVTRAQFTKMIVGALGLEAAGTTTFEDCPADAWYTPYVAAAVNAGIVNGVSDTWFDAEAQITREDICTIIGRALGAETPAIELTFSDAAEISDYALDYVKLLVDLKIVNGYEDGTFGPKKNATRAEAAKMIYGVSNIITPSVPEEAPVE